MMHPAVVRILLALSILAVVAPALVAQTEVVQWATGVNLTYDGAGNVAAVGTDRFVYDDVGRLVQAEVNALRRNYTYDAYGNRTGCTQASPSAACQFNWTIHPASNRISEARYDQRGNVTDLETHRYVYDPLNSMTSHQSTAYIYTADDERIATVAGSSWTWTIRDTANRVLREFTSQGGGTSNWTWKRDYIWRDGLLLASRQREGTVTTTYHYHLDHLGSPRRITDQNDAIVGFHDYHAFGPELSGGRNEPSPGTLKYTGHERDETGDHYTLDYMHARYYNPAAGRFLAVDPGGIDPKKPQSWNRYAYVMNNPVNAIDPNGKETYIVAYGQGELSPAMQGQTYDVGRQFEIAARTREAQIKASKGYNATSDDVVVVNTPNEAAFVTATNTQYPSGKIARVEVFSHAWSGGLNLGGTGNRHVRASTANQIDTKNFTRNASLMLWGCNTGTTPPGGGLSFAQQLSNTLQMPVRAHTGPTEFNNQGRGKPPMVPSNPQRGAMRVFNPQNPNLLPVP